jgi:hypothetical protein
MVPPEETKIIVPPVRVSPLLVTPEDMVMLVAMLFAPKTIPLGEDWHGFNCLLMVVWLSAVLCR